MKFNLKVLFILTTVLAIATAITISVVRHQIQLQAHRAEFEVLSARTSDFDSVIRAALAEQPEVAAILAAYETGVPENFISGGCGFSSKNGLAAFETEYRYSWQHPSEPNRFGSAEVVLTGEFEPEDLERHKIVIQHTDSKTAKVIVDRLKSELSRDKKLNIDFESQVF